MEGAVQGRGRAPSGLTPSVGGGLAGEGQSLLWTHRPSGHTAPQVASAAQESPRWDTVQVC